MAVDRTPVALARFPTAVAFSEPVSESTPHSVVVSSPPSVLHSAVPSAKAICGIIIGKAKIRANRVVVERSRVLKVKFVMIFSR